MKINKEWLEEYLGYELNNYKFEPQYDKDKIIAFNIKVEPKRKIEKLNLNITIKKSGDLDL